MLSLIQEEPKFKTEPQLGLHPTHVDVEKYNLTRYNEEKFPYKKFIPSCFQPHLPPLKRFDQFAPNETLSRPEDLYSLPPQNIQKIIFENIRIKSDRFHQKLSTYQFCSVLVMRSMMIESLVGITLPLLRVLDVRFNSIPSTEQILPMTKDSPFLEHLVVLDNPLERTQNWRQSLIGACPRLISLNGQTVLFSEREYCNELFGTPQSRQIFSFLKFDERMNVICEYMKLEAWTPENITSLDLVNAKLSEIHVGPMVNLKVLKVAFNFLTTLSGCGLERLDKLRELDVSSNSLADEKCLTALSYIPSLRSLMIKDNPIFTNESSENEIEELDSKMWLYIVYLTINLKGDNRNVGLLTIDDVPITVDDRLKSIKLFSSSVSDDDLRKLRWNYSLINYFGHNQLRKLCNGQFMAVVSKLVLPGCSLTLADLSYFVSLEYVDLHNNNLGKVIGLEKLKKLKHVDLSGNPRLDTDDVLYYLSRLTTLISVSTAVDLSSLSANAVDRSMQNATNLNGVNQSIDLHRVNTDSVKRTTMLQLLMDKNDKLLILDGVRIGIVERSRVIKTIRDLSEIEELKYRFYLAVLLQVLTNPFTEKLKLSYRDMIPGKLYDPHRITQLYLRDCGLKDAGTDLSPFINLKLLDISHNMINSVLDIGLEKCREIKHLDFSFNNISNKLQDIVNMINRMRDLEMISLHGNAELEKTKNYRMKILKEINTMKNVSMKLIVFNTKITSQERQTVWSTESNVSEQMVETRLQRVIEDKGYNTRDPHSIREINLNEAGISKLGTFLFGFTNLENVLLRGNQFATKLSIACPSIFNLRHIKRLDLRNNKLSDLDEIIFLVNQNQFLECIGIYSPLEESEDANFPTMTEQQIRQAIISRTPKLANIYCPFWEIDEKEITVNEIVAYWPIKTTNEKGKEVQTDDKQRRLFRFQSALFRRFIQTVREKEIWRVNVNTEIIVALDLSALRLEQVDFSSFKSLKKLSLSLNLLNDAAFDASGLDKTVIEELDLQRNAIQHLETIANFIDRMKSLKLLYLVANPCYKMTEKKMKKKTDIFMDVEQVGRRSFEKNVGYIESRMKLISMLKCTKDPEWSFMLDGCYVTVNERCESISKQLTLSELEKTRLQLVLNDACYTIMESTIVLNAKSLKLLGKSILEKYTNLVHLDLKNNSIRQLEKGLFQSLTKLNYLDLRNNDISTTEQEGVLDVIGECSSLRVLFLHNCGKEIFRNPNEYKVQVFTTLRALTAVDDMDNPFPLSKTQLLATQYLETHCKVSPNSLCNIVVPVPVQSLGQFWSILLALTSLVTLFDGSTKDQGKKNEGNQEAFFDLIGPTSINFTTIEVPISDYRFLLSSHIRTLDFVDDNPITYEDKAHTFSELSRLRKAIELKQFDTSIAVRPVMTYAAVKKGIISQLTREQQVEGVKGLANMIGSIQELKDEQALAVIPNTNIIESTPSESGRKRSKSLLHTSGKAQNLLVDPYGSEIPFTFIQDNFNNIEIIQIYRQFLSIRNAMVIPFEGFLEKIEILIFAIQLFAICFSLSVPWPSIYTMIMRWSVLSVGSIDLLWNTFSVNNYYIKYSLEMIVPLIILFMWLHTPSYKTATSIYLNRFILTCSCLLCSFFACLVLAAALAFVTFPSSYLE